RLCLTASRSILLSGPRVLLALLLLFALLPALYLALSLLPLVAGRRSRGPHALFSAGILKGFAFGLRWILLSTGARTLHELGPRAVRSLLTFVLPLFIVLDAHIASIKLV